MRAGLCVVLCGISCIWRGPTLEGRNTSRAMTTTQATAKQDRPDCPKGHTGRIRLYGRASRADRAFARPRFQCVPSDGTDKHTFGLPRRQPGHGHPNGMLCSNCEHEHGPMDGARVVPQYTQTINEIANVLRAVGTGDSLRVAGRDARQQARRYTFGPHGPSRTLRSYSSRQSVLAARYLDAYGSEVVRQVWPDHWPRLLVLDSQPHEIRPWGKENWGDWGVDMPRGGLLAAGGRDEDKGAAQVWRISLLADETHLSWLKFFAELPGTPEYVVADRADAIWKAVGIRWPNVVRFNCSWHLNQNLTEAGFRDGIIHGDSPFPALIEVAFHSVAEWERLYDLAERERCENVMVWMVDNDALIRHQIDLRAAYPTYPRSNMAAERPLRMVEGHVGERRRNFRNLARFATTLGLMTAHERGVADPHTYARIIREIVAIGVPDQNSGMDHGAFMKPAIRARCRRSPRCSSGLPEPRRRPSRRTGSPRKPSRCSRLQKPSTSSVAVADCPRSSSNQCEGQLTRRSHRDAADRLLRVRERVGRGQEWSRA